MLLPYKLFLLYILAIVSNGQTLPPPVIESDGQLTLGQKFQAVCHHTFTLPLAVTIGNMKWICNIADELYDSYYVGIDPVPGSLDLTAAATLTIKRIECDHDNVVCECVLFGLDADSIDISSQKSLKLNIITLVSNGQSVEPPVIDSDGQMTIGRKFEALCQHTYTPPNGVKQIEWECNTAEAYNSKRQPIKVVPGSRNRIAIAILTIKHVVCDHDNVVCECVLVGLDENNVPLSSQKSLKLNTIKNPQLPPTLTTIPGQSRIIENAVTEITCEANVRTASHDMNVFLSMPNNASGNDIVILTQRINSKIRNKDCSYSVRVKGVFVFTRQHLNYKLLCRVGSAVLYTSQAFAINYLVDQVTIKFNTQLITSNNTVTVSAEIGERVSVFCGTASYPSATFTFYLIETTTSPRFSYFKIVRTNESHLSQAEYSFNVNKKGEIQIYCTAHNDLPDGQTRRVTSHVFTLKSTDATSLGTIIGAVVGSIVAIFAITISIGACVYNLVLKPRRKHTRKEADNTNEDTGYDDPGVDMRTYETGHYETPIVTMQHSPVNTRRNEPVYEDVVEEYERSVPERQPGSQYTRLDSPSNISSLGSKTHPVD